MTCYACNESGHLIQQCPRQQSTLRTEDANGKETWATSIAQEEGNLNKTSRVHATRRSSMGRDNIEGIGRERKEEYDETGSAAQLAAEDAAKQM
jgi:hypothetical protein